MMELGKDSQLYLLFLWVGVPLLTLLAVVAIILVKKLWWDDDGS